MSPVGPFRAQPVLKAMSAVARHRGRRLMTQCMVRPCVARDFLRDGESGLASMYPAFALERLLLAHHGYQRVCDLISGQT